MQAQAKKLRKEMDRLIFQVGTDLEIPIFVSETGDWSSAIQHELPNFYNVKDFRKPEFKT